jgi:hypothetical protein
MTDNTTTTPRTPAPTMSTPEDRGTSDEVRDRAHHAADTAKHEVGRVAEEAKTHTSRLVGETGDRAREHADERLGQTAHAIEQLGTELDEMASSSSQPNGYLASLARDGAQTAHRLSQRLDTGGLDGVMTDVTRFARRRPGAFLAASFAVGLAFGRLTRNADFGRIKEELSHDGDGQSTRQLNDTPTMSVAGGTQTVGATP